MTTTFPTTSNYTGIPCNGLGGTPAPFGGVPFNGFTPAPYAGTTTGLGYPTFGQNGWFNTPGFGAPGFNGAGYTNASFNTFGQYNPFSQFNPFGQFNPFSFQWPQFQWAQTQLPQFGNWTGTSVWNGFGNRLPSFGTNTGFGFSPFNVPFGQPGAFNAPGFVPQGGFTPNFGGYPQGFVPQGFVSQGSFNPSSGFDPSFFTNTSNGISGTGGFTGSAWQPGLNGQSNPWNAYGFNQPFGSFTNTGFVPNLPFNFAQNFGFGVPTFGSFPWTAGSTQPFTTAAAPFNYGPSNYGSFNYGPSNYGQFSPGSASGIYGTPFNGQYANGVSPNGGPTTNGCNGIGLNREAA